jgi:hypothetical protein
MQSKHNNNDNDEKHKTTQNGEDAGRRLRRPKLVAQRSLIPMFPLPLGNTLNAKMEKPRNHLQERHSHYAYVVPITGTQ